MDQSFDRVVGGLAGLQCRRQSASTKPARGAPGQSQFKVGFSPEGRWRSRSLAGLEPRGPASWRAPTARPCVGHQLSTFVFFLRKGKAQVDMLFCSRRIFHAGFFASASAPRRHPALGMSSVALNPAIRPQELNLCCVWDTCLRFHHVGLSADEAGGYFPKDCSVWPPGIAGLLPRIGRPKQTGAAGTTDPDGPGFIIHIGTVPSAFTHSRL